jgi:cytochrome c-L
VHRRQVTVVVVAALVALGLSGSGDAAEDGIQFLDPLTNEPLQIALPPDASEAVKAFHQSGEDPYSGDEQAIVEGQRLYQRWCAACHLPDGSGRIGPRLNDDQWKYPRAATPVGKFEIIHAGGAGAMQAFGSRLDQDEILKLIAFLETLQKGPADQASRGAMRRPSSGVTSKIERSGTSGQWASSSGSEAIISAR